MNGTLESTFADGIEAELSALGSGRSRLQRHQRRVRTAAVAGSALALAGALTGAAVVVAGLPGETTVTALGSIVASGDHSGTATLDLGPAPEGADVVILDITCDKSGGAMEVLTVNNGGTLWDCSNPIFSGSIHITDGRMPAEGETAVTITAAEGTAWHVEARYGNAETSDWGVNARGETYGVPNHNGNPDLSAAQATNGEIGYIRTTDIFELDRSYIPVYTSDGVTVIGEFPNGVEE